MMISAVGRKKSSAARIQRLMEEEPLWAAAAIQRGPRTAAMLNSKTSQNPISRRSWDLASAVAGCKSWPSQRIYHGSRKTLMLASGIGKPIGYQMVFRYPD